jgi:hypothetical protein
MPSTFILCLLDLEHVLVKERTHKRFSFSGHATGRVSVHPPAEGEELFVEMSNAGATGLCVRIIKGLPARRAVLDLAYNPNGA